MINDEGGAGGVRGEAGRQDRDTGAAGQAEGPSEAPSGESEPPAPVDLDLAHDRAS